MDPNTDPGQQPNPGENGGDDAANPDTQKPTEAEGGEGKGDENKAAATEDGKPVDGQEEPAADGAPEEYASFELPEGYALEGERLTEVTALFKELGLSQEKAQRLVSQYCKADSENATILQTASETARTQQIQQWGEQAKAQLGEAYEPTVQKAFLAVQALGTEELRVAFETHGWGNHPELLRMFGKVGELLGERGMDTGKPGDPPPRELTLAERMYPSSS